MSSNIKFVLKRKASKRKSRRRRVAPSTGGSMNKGFAPLRIPRQLNLVVPPRMMSKFTSRIKFYVPIAGVSVGFFDVALNSLHEPWVQTQAYDTAPRVASLSTPASADAGFEGLDNWLTAAAGVKFYQKYRVHAARLKVEVISAGPVDNGEIAIVPWKLNDVINASIYTASMAPFSKSGNFNSFKSTKLSNYVKVTSLAGIPKIATSIDDRYQAFGAAGPAVQQYFRVLYGKGDGAVLGAGSLEFDCTLTCYAQLFDTTIGGQPEIDV